MSQLVGTFIQFAIGEALILKDDGQRVGCSLNLRFEKLLDAKMARIIPRRVVPVNQKSPLFVFGQERENGNILRGIVDRPFKEELEPFGNPFDGERVEEICFVLEHTMDAVRSLASFERQIERCAVAVQLFVGDCQAT